MELAGLLQALGSRVSLLVRGQRLLDRFDYELTDQLAENLKQQGVRIHFGYRLRELQRDGERVRAFGHDGPLDSVFDAVFFAAGRRGSSRGLGLKRSASTSASTSRCRWTSGRPPVCRACMRSATSPARSA